MHLAKPGDALAVFNEHEQKAYDVGKRSAEAYLQRRRWLFRRVETIEFVDRSAVKRRVSVDFHVSHHLPRIRQRVLVPLSTTPKWPPLANFSLRGPDGEPASLYRRDVNKALDFGLLHGVLESVCNAANRTLPEHLIPDLADLIASDQPLPSAVERLTSETWEVLSKISATDKKLFDRCGEALDLVGLLAARSMLWVPLQGTQPRDCIVKFSYFDKIEQAPRRLPLRVLTTLGWREQTIFVALPHSGLHTRYHLEVLAPPGAGIEIMAARTLAFPGATLPEPPESRQEHAGSPQDDEPTGSARVVDRRVHIYHPFRSAPSHRMFLQLRWAASREGYVTGCVTSAAIIALVMSVSQAWLTQISRGTDSTIVLLAVIPVVLGSILVKPAEHMLERGWVVGIRSMALLAGAIPIAGAFLLLLAKDEPGNPAVRTVWSVLTLASWAIVTSLTVSWIFAAHADDAGRDRRWTSAAPVAGLIAAAAIVAGSAGGEHQPFAVVTSEHLVDHMVDHRYRILLGAALLWTGAVAMWTFIAGTWWRIAKAPYRHRSTPDSAEADRGPLRGRHRAIAKALIVYSGLAWIVITAVTAMATAFETLVVRGHANDRHAASLARWIDRGANASIVPAIVFMIATASWLWYRRFSRRPSADATPPGRRQLSDRQAFASLVIATILAAAVLLLRLHSAIFPGGPAPIPPWVAWTVFGIWPAAVAAVTYDLRGELSPL